jgi:hypothetical protein
VLDLFPRYHFARMFQQKQQDLQRLILQSDARSVLTQLARPRVQLEASEPVARWLCLPVAHFGGSLPRNVPAVAVKSDVCPGP